MKKAILILLLLPIIASSQSFDVFAIDTSDYPVMKAKFFSVDENGDQILNHTTSDFEITENGNPAEVLSVSCPEMNDEPISIVIAVDISGSMEGERINTLKNSLNFFIDLVPNNGSEVAVIAFNSKNYFVSDFSRNKKKLKSNISNLSANGSTDFDAAFINPVAGALVAMDKAQYANRNVVIITDGFAKGNENRIIGSANSLGARIFGILVESHAPNMLINIFNSTGGRSFDNIITKEEFNESFSNINLELYNIPCELSWKSNPICMTKLDLRIENKVNKLPFSTGISLDEENLVTFDFNSRVIDFGEISTDTSLTITSDTRTQTITDVVFEPDFGYYEVTSPLPISFTKGESKELEIKYSNNSNEREYTQMTLVTNYCNNNISLLSGDKNKSISNKIIKLTHPNGGEVFSAGADTAITWKGVPQKEIVQLNFSENNGKDWESIQSTDEYSEIDWRVPIVESDSCLIAIDYYGSNNEENKDDMEVEWYKTYGGSELEESREILRTYDGGYLLSGSTESNDLDMNVNTSDRMGFLAKTDSSGELSWVKVYGINKRNSLESTTQTADSGYVFVGSVLREKYNTSDLWVVKVDSNGAVLWEKVYGGISDDYGESVKQTPDGGFIIAGASNSDDGTLSSVGNKGQSDIWVLKLDNNGDLVWSKTIGGSNNDFATDIVLSNDGGYVLTGVSASKDWGFGSDNQSSEDIFVIKLNSNGTEQWRHIDVGFSDDYASSITKTKYGKYVIAGSRRDINGNGLDGLVIKLSTSGSVEMRNQFGGSLNDVFNDVIELENGNILLTGYSASYNGDLSEAVNKGVNDIWILKLDEKGKIIWSNTKGGSRDDRGYSILQTEDNEFAIVGVTTSSDYDFEEYPPKGYYDIFMMKFRKTLPLQSDTSDAVFSIIIPKPTIQNNNIDMGEMIVGNTKDTIISSVICNRGNSTLHILGVDIAGDDAADFLISRGGGDFYLEKDQCQDMMFEFTPSMSARRTTWATIRTTIGNFVDTISITGRGINPLIEATTDVVDFGQFELGEGKDTTLFLVKNVGSEDITITETKITGPDMEQFDIITTPINFTISPGEDNDKELELNYTAKYGGRTSSIIEFHYDGVGSPLRSMLFAEGIGGEVYPQVPDAFVGERVELGLHLGRIKPEGLDEVATNFTATVSYNSTLLAPIDKNMTVTTENTTSFIEIEGKLSGTAQIATVPMIVGLGTAISSGLVVTEFQLYDANGDSVDYQIEPGVGEFNVLGICEEGGTRLVNPNGEQVEMIVSQDQMNTNATVSLNLIESGQTDLIIYDQLGNAIETAYSGTPNTGTKELTLDLSNFANGRYYIKLITPTITKTEIIEIVR